MKTDSMHKLSLVAAAAAVLVLAGCAAPSERTTYDKISADVASAASKPASAARIDEAVSNALLPPASALAAQLPKARPALEERFNVAFNNVPAQQFFSSLVAGTRYNMLVHPEVTGNISANLRDVTMVEALEAVRELYGYEFRIDGTRISIKPLTMQTRMFKVNYLMGARKGSSNLRVTSTSVGNAGSRNNGDNSSGNAQGNQDNGGNQNDQGEAGGARDSSSVSTSSSNDFWADLKAAIEAIVGVGEKGGRSVVISPQSGVLVIRAMAEELRNVDSYLKATQLSVDRQVILEAKILEVELNDSFQSGINWAAFRNSGNSRASIGMAGPGTSLSPLPANGSAPAALRDARGLLATAGSALANASDLGGSLFGLAFQTSNFAALISFLESQGTVHVLSSPRVATLNNQKAVLKIGTDEFYVTGVTTTTNTSATGNTVTPSVTLQPFFSGVVLDVTPQIDDSGNIVLHVHPSVSQVTTVTKGIDLGSAGSLTLPLAASSTSEIDSIVRGQNGQVVAIGGLMRQASTNDRSQVPGAGNLPVIGNLFKTKNNVNQKRELVVLIKPTIVEGGENWNQNLLDTSRRIQDLDPDAGRRK